MGYVYNLDPTLVEIGPFEIRYYGLVYVLGFLLAYYILIKYQKSGKLKVKRDALDSFILYLMISVIVGARLAHIFFVDPVHYLSYPLDSIKLWEGGLAFHGGFAGALLITWWFARKHNITFGKMADILVVPAVLALALGRIANFINAELVGTNTNAAWCVEFPGYEGCRHPSQLYGAVKRFAIFGILWYMSKKKHKEGYLFWMFVFLMGIGRFLLDFVREDPRLLGLSAGQYASLVMVLVGGYVLYKYYNKDLGIKKKLM